MTREDRDEFARLYDSSPDTIGGWGEVITASALRDLHLSVIRSLYIGHSQVDMVALAPAGVLVIENKNYHGVVSGHGKSKYWNVNYTPYKTHKLYNPVLQNARHVLDVRSMLELTGFSSIPVRSIVIFNDMTELRLIDMPSQVFKLRDFVESYEHPADGLSQSVLSDLAELFEKFRDGSDEARIAHIERLGCKSSG